MTILEINRRTEWRNWLSINHDKSDGAWLTFYKIAGGKPSLDYEAAVEEALCFGWIDSIIKKIDDKKYVRKFTPRNKGSKWSDLNKKRAEKMILEKRMTKHGMRLITAAKKSGKWEDREKPVFDFNMPADFSDAIRKDKKAGEYFAALAPSYKKQFILWINTAKQTATRDKRIKESIRLLQKGERLGLR